MWVGNLSLLFYDNYYKHQNKFLIFMVDWIFFWEMTYNAKKLYFEIRNERSVSVIFYVVFFYNNYEHQKQIINIYGRLKKSILNEIQ